MTWRPVAVPCVTRVQLVLALAAPQEVGRRPGDRIEHGAVIPKECLADLRGLTVVTQPHFVAERAAQYRSEVPAADLPDLWRLRSLLAAAWRWRWAAMPRSGALTRGRSSGRPPPARPASARERPSRQLLLGQTCRHDGACCRCVNRRLVSSDAIRIRCIAGVPPAMAQPCASRCNASRPNSAV